MGLIVEIYKDAKIGPCSNGGLSERFDELTLVNVDGPFEPTEDRPAAMLVDGNRPGLAKVVECELVEATGAYLETRRGVGPMMGGCYVATSDSRFSEAVEQITGARWSGAVPLHDRFETQAQYDQMEG